MCVLFWFGILLMVKILVCCILYKNVVFLFSDVVIVMESIILKIFLLSLLVLVLIFSFILGFYFFVKMVGVFGDLKEIFFVKMCWILNWGVWVCLFVVWLLVVWFLLVMVFFIYLLFYLI